MPGNSELAANSVFVLSEVISEIGPNIRNLGRRGNYSRDSSVDDSVLSRISSSIAIASLNLGSSTSRSRISSFEFSNSPKALLVGTTLGKIIEFLLDEENDFDNDKFMDATSIKLRRGQTAQLHECARVNSLTYSNNDHLLLFIVEGALHALVYPSFAPIYEKSSFLFSRCNTFTFYQTHNQKTVYLIFNDERILSCVITADGPVFYSIIRHTIPNICDLVSAGDFAIFGGDTEYFCIKLNDQHVTISKILDSGTHIVNSSVIAKISEDEILLPVMTDKYMFMGIFMHPNGLPTRGTFTWSASVKSVAIHYPYVFALLINSYVEISNIHTLSLVESIFVNPRLAPMSLKSPSSYGWPLEFGIAVVCTEKVLLLNMGSLGPRLEEMINQEQYSKATLLSMRVDENRKEYGHFPEDCTKLVHMRAGKAMWEKGNFSDAFYHFYQATIDPRIIISLFPDISEGINLPGFKNIESRLLADIEQDFDMDNMSTWKFEHLVINENLEEILDKIGRSDRNSTDRKYIANKNLAEYLQLIKSAYRSRLREDISDAFILGKKVTGLCDFPPHILCFNLALLFHMSRNAGGSKQVTEILTSIDPKHESEYEKFFEKNGFWSFKCEYLTHMGRFEDLIKVYLKLAQGNITDTNISGNSALSKMCDTALKLDGEVASNYITRIFELDEEMALTLIDRHNYKLINDEEIQNLLFGGKIENALCNKNGLARLSLFISHMQIKIKRTKCATKESNTTLALAMLFKSVLMSKSKRQNCNVFSLNENYKAKKYPHMTFKEFLAEKTLDLARARIDFMNHIGNISKNYYEERVLDQISQFPGFNIEKSLIMYDMSKWQMAIETLLEIYDFRSVDEIFKVLPDDITEKTKLSNMIVLHSSRKLRTAKKEEKEFLEALILKYSKFADFEVVIEAIKYVALGKREEFFMITILKKTKELRRSIIANNLILLEEKLLSKKPTGIPATEPVVLEDMNLCCSVCKLKLENKPIKLLPTGDPVHKDCLVHQVVDTNIRD